MGSGRSGRAQAIPLVTLVSVVAVLALMRAREGARSAAKAPAAAARNGIDAGDAYRDCLALAPDPALLEAGSPEGGAPHQLHGDAHRAHRSPFAGPPRASLAWNVAVGGPIEAQVVASNDESILYVASLDGALSALSVADGARLWSVPLGERVYGTPLVAPDGTIYVGSDAKRFFAITPAGKIVWTLETAGEADTSPSLTRDHLVVFAAGPSVYAVRSGGDIAWRFDAKGKVFTAPALTDDGHIVVGSQDHHAYILAPTGALAASVDLGSDIDGAPAIADDGTLVVGTDGGEVVRLRPSGEIVSRAKVGGFVRGPLAIASNGDALAGVYGPTPRVVRVAPDGTLRADFPVPGTGAREFGVHGAPLEDRNGALFFGAQDDVIRALGPCPAGAEGAAVPWSWSFRTGGDVDAPLTLLSSGALVGASDDGHVYLFSP